MSFKFFPILQTLERKAVFLREKRKRKKESFCSFRFQNAARFVFAIIGRGNKYAQKSRKKLSTLNTCIWTGKYLFLPENWTFGSRELNIWKQRIEHLEAKNWTFGSKELQIIRQESEERPPRHEQRPASFQRAVSPHAHPRGWHRRPLPWGFLRSRLVATDWGSRQLEVVREERYKKEFVRMDKKVPVPHLARCGTFS